MIRQRDVSSAGLERMLDRHEVGRSIRPRPTPSKPLMENAFRDFTFVKSTAIFFSYFLLFLDTRA